MHVLTPEERRAKFASAPKNAGLRSKGAELLSSDDQERILGEIDDMQAATKLHQLRALREASIASKTSPDLARRIFLKSAEVLAETDHKELLPVLEHLCRLSTNKLHAKWLALALVSEGHFHRAFWIGLNDNAVFTFSRAIVSRDVMAWHNIVTNESGTTRAIMLRSRHYFDADLLARTFRQDMAPTIERLIACKICV